MTADMRRGSVSAEATKLHSQRCYAVSMGRDEENEMR